MEPSAPSQDSPGALHMGDGRPARELVEMVLPDYAQGEPCGPGTRVFFTGQGEQMRPVYRSSRYDNGSVRFTGYSLGSLRVRALREQDAAPITVTKEKP